MSMTEKQMAAILVIAETFAEKYPDILENFQGMINEYRATAELAGVTNPEEELPLSAKFFSQVVEMLMTLEALNG